MKIYPDNRDYPENSPIWYGSPPHHNKNIHGWIEDEAQELISKNRVINANNCSDFTIKTHDTLEEKIIKCIDCHKDFIFTKGEQQFFEVKGYDAPKRCKSCKSKNKDRTPINSIDIDLRSQKRDRK